jgi:hypothetical protein
MRVDQSYRPQDNVEKLQLFWQVEGLAVRCGDLEEGGKAEAEPVKPGIKKF